MVRWILPGSLSIVETNLGIRGREGGYDTPGVANEKILIHSPFGNPGTTADVAAILYKKLQYCKPELVGHFGKVKIKMFYYGPDDFCGWEVCLDMSWERIRAKGTVKFDPPMCQAEKAYRTGGVKFQNKLLG